MCIKMPSELKCIEVKILDDEVVIVDEDDSNNKIKISKEDWNDLVSKIRKGTLAEIK